MKATEHGGVISAGKRWIRRVALQRGLFIGRVEAGEALNTLQSHLAYVLSELKINCVLDVGAHKGEYAGMLRNLGFNGRIVSFEPVADHYAALVENRHGDARWSGHQLALGSDDGAAEIHVSRASTFASLLRPSDYGRERLARQMREVRCEQIQIRRLDGLYAECVAGIDEPRVLLKTDTQGFDMAVIEGAKASMGDIRVLQAEVAVKHMYEGMTTGIFDLIPRLQSLGFELTCLVPVARDPVDHLRIIEMDCVLCRLSGDR